MTQEEINNFADKVYHAKMEQIPTILEDLVKSAQSKMYSEKDLKQFAFECVAKFLSNDDNKIEMKLVEVISDRLDTHFENFKKK